MPNAFNKIEVEFSEEELAELAELDSAEVGEQLIDKFNDACAVLTSLGLNPEIILAALLQVYCDQAAEFGDRSLYEEQLSVAMEDQWPEQWIH